MRTAITELFGIRYPVLLPGMSHVSMPPLVAAVSEAGGLGILATGPLSAIQTREAIEEIRRRTAKPFGVGISLMLPGAKENAEVALAERVPVINYSLGKGDWITEQAHAQGLKVIATVVNARHALAAQRYGADALQVTGHEAAAHGGAVTSLVLLPSIIEQVEIPVVAAGGFGSGRGLIAALALGAAGVAMGSRFAASSESPIHANTKELIVHKSVEETLYTDKFDGMMCRVMESNAAHRAIAEGSNFLLALRNSFDLARRMGLSWFKLALAVAAKGPDHLLRMTQLVNASELTRLAIHEGDTERGVQLIGQVQGLIHDLPTVAQLMERVMAEAEATRHDLDRDEFSGSIS